MTIELGINWFECNSCGALIYPPSIISTKAQKKHIEKIELPPVNTKLPDSAFMLNHPMWDDIQAGLYDDVPHLVRFKGVPYPDCIKILRAEYKTWRDDFIIVKRAEAGTRETELAGKAVSALKTETEDAITLEADRFEAVYEGTDKEGRTLCPKCSRVLCSWTT